MRNIFVVNATQVVISENHPEGLFSVIPGFPKNFDSANYNDDVETAMKAAKAAYYDQLSKSYAYTNRAMAAVTLESANGYQFLHESIGSFPELESVPNEEELVPEEPIE